MLLIVDSAVEKQKIAMYTLRYYYFFYNKIPYVIVYGSMGAFFFVRGQNAKTWGI